jgi:hypothetical protein
VKVGIDLCDGLECLKYKVNYGLAGEVDKYIWFDTSKYLLRKQMVIGAGEPQTLSFSYDLSKVRFPSKQELSLVDSDYGVAVGLLEDVEEVVKIRNVIEKAGNKLIFMDGGEKDGEVMVGMSESLSDHTSRIATFYVNVQTGLITVDDVVRAKRISLEEWKKQVRESWGF